MSVITRTKRFVSDPRTRLSCRRISEFAKDELILSSKRFNEVDVRKISDLSIINMRKAESDTQNDVNNDKDPSQDCPELRTMLESYKNINHYLDMTFKSLCTLEGRIIQIRNVCIESYKHGPGRNNHSNGGSPMKERDDYDDQGSLFSRESFLFKDDEIFREEVEQNYQSLSRIKSSGSPYSSSPSSRHTPRPRRSSVQPTPKTPKSPVSPDPQVTSVSTIRRSSSDGALSDADNDLSPITNTQGQNANVISPIFDGRARASVLRRHKTPNRPSDDWYKPRQINHALLFNRSDIIS